MYNAYIRQKCTLWFYPSTISKTVFSLSLSPSLPISVSPSLSSLNIYANILKPEKKSKNQNHFWSQTFWNRAAQLIQSKRIPRGRELGVGAGPVPKPQHIQNPWSNHKGLWKETEAQVTGERHNGNRSMKTCRSDKGCPLHLCKDSLTVCVGYTQPHVKAKVLLGLV